MLDRHGDVCFSTVTQHLRRSVHRNGWTRPVELTSLPSKLQQQCDSLKEFKRLLKTHPLWGSWHFVTRNHLTYLLCSSSSSNSNKSSGGGDKSTSSSSSISSSIGLRIKLVSVGPRPMLLL